MPCLDGDRLRPEPAIRGLLEEDLAKLARVTPSTVPHAFTGRPVATQTLMKIASALVVALQLRGAEEITPRPGGDGHARVPATPSNHGSTEDRES